MKKPDHLSPKDLELLSAYIDGECSSKEAAGLEARLQVERRLQRALGELRATSGLLRALPDVAPPRRLVLTPEMVGIRPRRVSPTLRLATALASIAFAALVGLDAITFLARPLGGMLAPGAELREMAVQEAEATEEPMLAADLQAAPAEGTPTLEPPSALGMEQMTPAETEGGEAFAAQAVTEMAAAEAQKGAEKLTGVSVAGVGAELPAPTSSAIVPEDQLPEPSSDGRLRMVEESYWRIGLRVGEIAFGLAAIVLASIMLWTRRK